MSYCICFNSRSTSILPLILFRFSITHLSLDENLVVLREGCFSYFKMGGECIRGPVGLLSGITRSRMVLVYHFYYVALHSIWLLFHKATWAEVPATILKAFAVMWTACVVLLPVMWSELKA